MFKEELIAHRYLCFGASIYMICNGDTAIVCGVEYKLTNYLCTFSRLELELHNFINISTFSALITYQIVSRLTRSLHLLDYHMLLHDSYASILPFGDTHVNANTHLVYLCTVWTTHGKGINIWIRAIPIKKPNYAFVSVSDGPTFVKSFFLGDLSSHGYRYQALFSVTIGVMLIDTGKRKVAKLSHYQK